jgi:hypothetical protein
MKDRLKKLAMMKASKKDGGKDPEAMPGFKPRPFMEKIKDKKKSKPTTLEMKPGMRKNMPANMRKMKNK